MLPKYAFHGDHLGVSCRVAPGYSCPETTAISHSKTDALQIQHTQRRQGHRMQSYCPVVVSAGGEHVLKKGAGQEAPEARGQARQTCHSPCAGLERKGLSRGVSDTPAPATGEEGVEGV